MHASLTFLISSLACRHRPCTRQSQPPDASPLRCNLPVPGRAANACNTFGLAMNHDQGCSGCCKPDGNPKPEIRDGALEKKEKSTSYPIRTHPSVICSNRGTEYHHVFFPEHESLQTALPVPFCTTTALREQPQGDRLGWLVAQR